jgi:hypothetical protein
MPPTAEVKRKNSRDRISVVFPAVVWTQWRTGRRRYIALRRHGIGPSLAATTTAAPARPLAAHAFFAAGGLPTLEPAVA